MKKFRYLLPGMLVLLCIFYSCSIRGMELDGDTVAEGASPEEEAADKEAVPEEKKKPGEKPEIPEEAPPALVFISCKTVSEREIVFEFSRPVTLFSLSLSPEMEYETIEEGSTVKVNLAEDPEPGLLVEVEILVEDEYENTINEQVSFRTRNNRPPALQINELYTEYSKPKAEFIEFKILSDGNLGALRVFVVGNNKNPLLYEFDPVEVKKEEYVVLHLRTLEDSCKNEYDDNLEKSGGTFSSPTARDLWIPGSSKLLRKTDAVYVLDQDDVVLDAVMISETAASSWDKAYFSEAAEFLFNKNAWKSLAGTSCSPADAVNSTGITATKSISRDETAENTHTAADWYVTKTNGVTPGLPNSPYSP